MAVIVPIIADTSGFTRALGKSQGGLARFGKTAAFVAGAAALGGLVATLRVGVSEFMDQQKVAAQTNAVLKSTGSIAKVTAQEMNQLSESLMRKSGVDDEAIQSSQNLLLTFTQIRNETGKGNDIFDQATKATLDLSVAMGKDLNSSAILVGKALNDPVKGATALSRAGVQLTEGQKNQIKAFVESGRVLEAQKIILGELTTQFGGSAEAAGKTLPGQLNILKQTFNNLAGELAAKFLPGVARAAQALIDFLGKFSAAPTLDAKVRVIIGGIVDATGRVFPINKGSFDVSYRKWRDAAGIEDLKFHDTRHEGASRLAKLLPPMELAKMLGHRDMNMTLNTYYNPKATELVSKLREGVRAAAQAARASGSATLPETKP